MTNKNDRGRRRPQNTLHPGKKPLQKDAERGEVNRSLDSARTRVKVPGVRRVWGTKKDAPSAVVLQTVRQLSKADSEKRLTVKRKFKEGGSGRRDRWWFLLHGPESTLEELSNAWSSISLQVGWKLETCTKPIEEDVNARVSEGAQNEEQGVATNSATNSDASQTTIVATEGASNEALTRIQSSSNDGNSDTGINTPFLEETNTTP